MKIEREKDPVVDGLYVIYTIGLVGYTERELVMWLTKKGGWYYRFSNEQFKDEVFGWIGPLPDNFEMKSWDEVFSDMRKTDGAYVDRAVQPPQEYDL